ncbi:MAG: amino acid permease, partial [Bacteroidetes bacterium]|nr:amino acid permease [Bacteroidota bacterium]
WFFTLVNTRSIRSVGIVQLITTILKILPLVLIGSFGYLYFNSEHFSPLNVSTSSSFEAISATAALTLWAFLGLESATIPSDKVKNPRKTIPRATIAGLLIVALIYIASTVAIMGIMQASELQDSAAPFADAAQEIWGDGASYLLALGAAISCFGALNGWILIQGQLPLAAASDNIFPAAFKKLSKNGIPITGIIISSILASLLVGMNYSKGLVKMFTFIIMLSTLTCLLPYLFSSLTEISLHLKRKIPYNKRKFTIAIIISIPAFIYSMWAIWGLGIEIIGWGIALLSAGIPIFLYKKYSGKK